MEHFDGAVSVVGVENAQGVESVDDVRREVGVGRKSWVDIKGNAGHQSREEALSDRMLELDQIIEKQINHHHDIHV